MYKKSWYINSLIIFWTVLIIMCQINAALTINDFIKNTWFYVLGMALILNVIANGCVENRGIKLVITICSLSIILGSIIIRYTIKVQ